MGKRVIRGLRWARALARRPARIPIGRPRGAKRQGIRYENALAEVLGPLATHGQWFEYEDANGHGYCQVDFLIPQAKRIVVLECKYSWVPEAHVELERLYGPVVEGVFGVGMKGVVVAKRLVPGMRGIGIAASLDEALGLNGPTVWHWLGAPCPTPFVRALVATHELGLGA